MNRAIRTRLRVGGAWRTPFALVALVGAVIWAPMASAAYSGVVLADSPEGYWRLDETSGSSAIDSTGHGHAGSYVNVGLGADGAFAGANGAAEFPDADLSQSVDRGVSVGPIGPIGWRRLFTFEAWVATAYRGFGAIADRRDEIGFDWSITVDNDSTHLGAVKFSTNDGCSRFNAYGNTIDDGGWHHVVVSEDTSAVTIYVDGVGTVNHFPPLPPGHCSSEPTSSSAPVRLGNVFAGDLDEVAIYNATLSSARVSAHYNAGGTVPPPVPDANLTPEQQTRAQQLAVNDPRIVQLLAGHTLSVSGITPWTTLTGASIGAYVQLTWSDPAMLQDDWPEIEYDDTESTPPFYTQLTSTYTAAGVVGLDVLVDLNRNLVVSFEPSGDPQISNASDPGSSSAGEFSDPTTRHLQVVRLGDDRLWNYDFNQQDPTLAGRRRANSPLVDWPFTLVFWNGADKDLAKVWGDCTIGFCSQAWAYLSNTGTFGWVGDRGSARGTPCIGKKLHYRVYADGVHSFTTRWGFYVLATTHYDWHELCKGAWHGMSEDAANAIINAGESQNAGPSGPLWSEGNVDRLGIPFWNVEGYRDFSGPPQLVKIKPRIQGKHRWQSDGWAETIKVCQGASQLVPCP